MTEFVCKTKENNIVIFVSTDEISDEDFIKTLSSEFTLLGELKNIKNKDKNRDWRDAWMWNESTEQIDVDINKAVDIVKDKLRWDRATAFKILDLKFMLALEAGTDTTEIVKEKQRLRDITEIPTTKMSLNKLKQITI